jgi:hypothetical protein
MLNLEVGIEKKDLLPDNFAKRFQSDRSCSSFAAHDGVPKRSACKNRVDAMSPKYDMDYLVVRETEERLAARYAACAPSRQAHAKLADLLRRPDLGDPRRAFPGRIATSLQYVWVFSVILQRITFEISSSFCHP